MSWHFKTTGKVGVIIGLLAALMSIPVSAESVVVDPTAPIGWQKPVAKPRQVKQPLPALQSVICTNTCDAVIAGKIVTSGDSVNGYRVGKISDSSVLLYRDGKQWQLSLFRDQVKQY